MNLLLQLLARKRDDILARWLDRILDSYSADSLSFFKQEEDRFRNPVGHTLRENLPVLLESLLHGEPAGASRSALAAIIRMRAVQDFSPAEAVAFVPILKDIMREDPGLGRQIEACECDYAEFEGRLEAMTLLAAELHAECRDQIVRIKANELRRRTHVIERANRS